MIYPRILIRGSADAALPWIGYAKKLARQTYQNGIINKHQKVSSDVSIYIRNFIGTGISKVVISGGVSSYGFILLPKRSGVADYGWLYENEEFIPLTDDVNYFRYWFIPHNVAETPKSFFGVRYKIDNSISPKIIPGQPLLAGNQFIVRHNDKKLTDVYSYWGSPYGDLSIGRIAPNAIYCPYVRRVNQGDLVFFQYAMRTPKSLEPPFPEYPMPIWMVYKNGDKFIDIGGPNYAVVGVGLFSSSFENPIHKNKLLVIDQYGDIRVYSEQGNYIQTITSGIRRGNYTESGINTAIIDDETYYFYVEYSINAENLFSGYEWKFSEDGHKAALIKIDPVDSILVFTSATTVEIRPVATILYQLSITENNDEEQTLSVSVTSSRYKIEDTAFNWNVEFNRWQYGQSLVAGAPYEEAMFSKGGQLFPTEAEAIAYGQSKATTLIEEQPPETWLLADNNSKLYELSYPYAVNYRGNDLLIAWITLSKQLNKDYRYFSARETSPVTTVGQRLSGAEWDHRNLFTVTQPVTGESNSVGVYRWSWVVKFEDGTEDSDSPTIPLLVSNITERGYSDYSYISTWAYDPAIGNYNDKSQLQQTNSSYIRDVKTSAFRFAQLSWKFYLWNEYLSEDSLEGTYLYKTHIQAGSILEDISSYTTKRRETTDVGLTCFTKLPNLDELKIHETGKNVEEYPPQYPYYDVSIFPINGGYTVAYDYVPGVITLQRPFGPIWGALDRRADFLPYILEEKIVESYFAPFTYSMLRSNIFGFDSSIERALAAVGGTTDVDQFGPIGLY